MFELTVMGGAKQICESLPFVQVSEYVVVCPTDGVTGTGPESPLPFTVKLVLLHKVAFDEVQSSDTELPLRIVTGPVGFVKEQLGAGGVAVSVTCASVEPFGLVQI